MINLDQLTSTAIRNHADLAPALNAQIEQVRAEAKAKAETMTKPELIVCLTEAIPSNKHLASSKKDILVDLFRALAVKNSGAYKEMTDLEAAVNADRWTVRQINKMITDAVEAQAKVAEQAAAPDGMFMFAEHAEAAILAAATARYAHTVIRGVGNGNEITEVVAAVAKDAMRTVLNLADSVLINGGRAERVNEAVGARRFLNGVREAYGDMITVSLHDVL